MVSVLAWSAIDRKFKLRSGQTKDYKIGICCFSAKHAALRSKNKLNKDGLARNQVDVSKWGDVSIHTVVSLGGHYWHPTKHARLVQIGLHHHLIEN
jgi:hypothetical protein